MIQAADGAAVTFRELDRPGRRVAVGAGPAIRRFAGRAVVFAAPPGLGWWEVFLGLLKAGAVVVPLDGADRRSNKPSRASFGRAPGGTA